MNRNTIATLLAALALAFLAMVVGGCASSGAGAGADIPAVAPTPAKKPFAAPSYEASVYSSDEYGFSVHYPSDFDEAPGQGLFSAASPQQVPRIDISVSPNVPGASLDAIAKQLETVLAQVGGGEAQVTGSKETTLQDGVTPAKEFLVDWTFQGFPISSLVLATVAGDQMVNVQVTTMQGAVDEQIREIAYTLYFK